VHTISQQANLAEKTKQKKRSGRKVPTGMRETRLRK
jgi:hypothetical protein